MLMKVILEVEVETAEGADPKAIVSGIVDKLGDGELTVPIGSTSMASLGQAHVKEMKAYTTANQSATW